MNGAPRLVAALLKMTLCALAFLAITSSLSGEAQSPAPTTTPSVFTGTFRVDGVGGSLPWTVTLTANGADVSGSVSQCANSRAAIYDSLDWHDALPLRSL